MELRLKCDVPALADASYRLIDLVDRVLKRHPGKANHAGSYSLFVTVFQECPTEV